MSWYIQQLLRNSIEIRTKADTESDEFNDLLVIETRIKSLRKDCVITDEELALIKYIEDGKPLVDSKSEFGKNRVSLSRDFVRLCDKLAFYIGGYFTEYGYVQYMKNKHNLTEHQVGLMINYMNGRYKNKLIRKTPKTNEQE